MAKVYQPRESPQFYNAFSQDDQVLVEEFIQGREFSIGLATLNEHLEVLPATEIISKTDFFDFKAK